LSGGPISLVNNSTQTFGPFINGASISVSCISGTAEYVVDLAPVLTDGSGGTTAVATATTLGLVKGAGIAADGTLSSSIGLWARTGITCIGDSIMAYGDGIGAGGTIAGPTSQAIHAWAFYLWKKSPLHVVANRAVGGVTIDTVISSQLLSAITDSSDILWIHCGVNNLNPSIDATTPTVSVILDRMRRLLEVATTKPLVILDAITPLAATSISGAFPRRADIPLVNAGYKALAATFTNVIFNDIYTPLAQDAVSGLAVAGMCTAFDGIHLTTKGAYTAGLASYRVLAASGIALRQYHRPTTANLLPTITGSTGTTTPAGGTINGAVADNCNVQIASNQVGVVVTASVGASRANSQRLRIQNGNGASTAVRFQFAVFTNYLAGLSSGVVVRGSGYVDVVSQTGLYRHDLSLQQDPSGAVVNFSSLQKSNQENGTSSSFPVYPDAPYSVREVPIGTLTATPTSFNLAFTIEVAPGGDVTVDMYGWMLEVVTIY
jgi:lysophospholipase L1-like esterase